VHRPHDAAARLARLERPAGAASRDLTLGLGAIRFEGLADAQARVVDERWGGFVGAPSNARADVVVRCVAGDGTAWLPKWSPGERYRVEAGAGIVQSYHFALMPQADGAWRLAVVGDGAEPLGRVLDNAARFLVALLALDRGGFAIHGAGVRRGGRAWIFAGVSGTGKTTAVRLSAPAESLGDDFAIVVPQGDTWSTCALPFDNAERAPARRVPGLVPLGAVCRLFQAEAHGIERPAAPIAEASLMSCLAFPGAIPDIALRAAPSIAALIRAGKFLHLRFAPDAGFWGLLEA